MTRIDHKSPEIRHEAPVQITPELIDYYVRYGNHLRAAMAAAWLRGIAERLARLWRPARPRARESTAERFANGLAAIRSSAEILRDTPDLSAADRARFLEIVLAEERRMADALAGRSVPGFDARGLPDRA